MDTFNEVSAVGARLRELRESADCTVEEMAARLSVAPDVYAAYEENGKDIPISVIFEAANLFNVDFNEILTGDPARLSTYHIVRRGDGKVVNRRSGLPVRGQGHAAAAGHFGAHRYPRQADHPRRPGIQHGPGGHGGGLHRRTGIFAASGRLHLL